MKYDDTIKALKSICAGLKVNYDLLFPVYLALDNDYVNFPENGDGKELMRVEKIGNYASALVRNRRGRKRS